MRLIFEHLRGPLVAGTLRGVWSCFPGTWAFRVARGCPRHPHVRSPWFMSHPPDRRTRARPIAARPLGRPATLLDTPLATTRVCGTAAVVTTAVIATAIIVVSQASGFWLLMIAAAPLYLAYRTHLLSVARAESRRRHFEEVAELHLSTVEALALAIDAKDQTATSHIRRVQRYAAAVAQAIGMTPHEVQGVRMAALLHDIGKLAVPEHILSKPGPLTEEEFLKVQIHPQIGAEIIGAVPVPVSRGPAHPRAPRALGRQGLSERSPGGADTARGENPLGGRLLRRADVGPSLPRRAQ